MGVDLAHDDKALFLQLHRDYQDNLRSISIPGGGTRDDDGDILWNPETGGAIDMAAAKAEAAGRIVTRHGLAHPTCLPHLDASDTGPFCIVNRDFHPRNAIADPEAGRIRAVFDWGRPPTRSLPAAFAEDPPLFLRPLLLFHSIVLRRLPQWEQAYAPLLDTFLGILQRLEAQQPPPEPGDEGWAPLSARMRASRASKQWLEQFFVHDLDVSDATTSSGRICRAG